MRCAWLLAALHLLAPVVGCSSGAAERPKPQAPGGAAQASDVPGRAVQLRGSRVRLWLPDTATRPTRVFGFHNQNPNLAVILSELTAPNDQAATELMLGMKEGAHEFEPFTDTTRGSAKGFTGRGETNGLAVRFMALQHGRAAATISLVFDPGAAVVAEKVLGSVEFDGAAPLDPLAIHGVSIGRTEGMEVWPIMSQPILLREPGVEPPFPPDKASLALVIAPLPKPNPTDEELGLYLGGMLKDLKPDMNQVKSRDTTVSGVPSVELIVPGENDGEPVMIYGFVVRTKDSLFGGFGHVGQKRADVFMPKFAKIVESIRLDDSVLGPLPR